MSQDGADYPVGQVYSYQDANEDKNHNYGATLPVNRQPGSINALTVGRPYLRGASEDIELWSKNSGIRLENMITNSLFGVWSRSDVAKGLGEMQYDSGAVAPTVGEIMTGATSGATGVVIYFTVTGGSWGAGSAAGMLYLGRCDGRFNDNEDVNGSVGGANMLIVDRAPAGRGVDIIQNGEYQTATTGWAGTDCTLASVAGGQIGNCLELTRTGGAVQLAWSNPGVAAGKIYKLSVYVQTGTSGNEAFEVRVWDNNAGAWIENPLISGTTAAGWVRYQRCFEAPAGCTNIIVYLVKATATAGTMRFDECSIYEISPCCTAADALAMDGWQKQGAGQVDLYREHSGTNTQAGSFYALKFVPVSAATWAVWPNSGLYALPHWYTMFQGKTVTFGAWVKTSAANHARLALTDSTGTTYSSYHTGGGAYEWLEVTRSVAAAATSFYCTLNTAVAGNVTGATIVYFSQPMLAFAPALGTGNYQRIIGEIIWLDAFIPSTNPFMVGTGKSSTGYVACNLEADSEAMLPKGIKSFCSLSTCRDSGSFANECYFRLQANNNFGPMHSNRLSGRGNNLYNAITESQAVTLEGDFEFLISASGAGTFDVAYHQYKGIELR